MIQLSTMPTKSPENRTRPNGPADRNGDFASRLDRKLNHDERSGGKIQPKDGKELPDELPEAAHAGRDRAETVGKRANLVAGDHANRSVVIEAEVEADAEAVSEDAEKVAGKVIGGKEASAIVLPVMIEIAPVAAALQVDEAKAETTDETGDPRLDHSGPRIPAPAQGTFNKTGGSDRDRALPRQLVEGVERAEVAGEKSAASPEAKQDAGVARSRVPQEFSLEIAKSGKVVNGAEPAGSRGVHASTIVLPATPAVNVQGDTAGLSPGAKPAFDAASIQQPVRPQDFSALVDRLVEARESARAGSVNLSVMHSDFGEVSLRFNHDNGNLSVAMSSRDPDFARAVNAATAADSSQAGETPFQGGRREDGAGSSSSRADGSANPSTPEERKDQGRITDRDAAEHGDAKANPTGTAGRTARGGIYA